MKFMQLRRDGTCSVCVAAISAGTWAHWDAGQRAVLCVGCRPGMPHPVGAEVDVLRVNVTAETKEFDAAPDVVVEVEVDADTAGRSAMKEYQKRASRERGNAEAKISADAVWRAEIREQRPILGRLAAARTPRPTIGPETQSTKAWSTGAAGERRVAEVLAKVERIEVLHDRLAPGRGAANIDHIVVSGAGVFVIDAKKYGGCLEVRDKGSMFRSDERLFVAGRDRTSLLDGVRQQVDDVRTVLGDDWSHVVVRPVLCFVGCEWTRLKEKNLYEVAVVWPKALPKLVSADGPHWAQVADIASHLRRLLKQPK